MCNEKKTNKLILIGLVRFLLVNQVIGGGLIKGVVKLEGLILQVLGQVHLVFWFMNH